MPTIPLSGMNDLNGIEAKRTAIVNMREALGNKLGQIDYDIAALQNDSTQLENVHKLFTQRIQIGQHLSVLYENLKWCVSPFFWGFLHYFYYKSPGLYD